MNRSRASVRLAIGLILLFAILPAPDGARAQSERDATPAASPVVIPTCAGAISSTPSSNATPAGDSGITRVLAGVVGAMAACWNAGDWSGYASFFTPGLLTAQFGTAAVDELGSRWDALTARKLLAPLEIQAAQYGRLVNDTTASIQVVWRQGFARHHEAWSFARGAHGWQLSEIGPLDIVLDAPAVGLRLELTDSGISVPLIDIAQTSLTVLEGVNETGGPFVLTVFALAADADPGSLIAGAPADFFVGSVLIESETARNLVLDNVPPGTYVIATNLQVAIAANDPTLLHWVRITITAIQGLARGAADHRSRATRDDRA